MLRRPCLKDEQYFEVVTYGFVEEDEPARMCFVHEVQRELKGK